MSQQLLVNYTLLTDVWRFGNMNTAHKHTSRSSRSTRNVDTATVNANFASMSWPTTVDVKANVNNFINSFYEQLISIWNKLAPTVTRQVRKRYSPGRKTLVFSQ